LDVHIKKYLESHVREMYDLWMEIYPYSTHTLKSYLETALWAGLSELENKNIHTLGVRELTARKKNK